MAAEVGKLLGEEKVDAIVCVAGGWAGGSAKSKCESFSPLIIRSALFPAGTGWVYTLCQPRRFSVCLEESLQELCEVGVNTPILQMKKTFP